MNQRGKTIFSNRFEWPLLFIDHPSGVYHLESSSKADRKSLSQVKIDKDKQKIIGFSFLNCTTGGTFAIHVKYQSSREFPSLQQKLGTTLGIAPFKDERSDTLYIDRHTSFRGISGYFKTDPFPLEKTFEKSISNIISRQGAPA